MARANAIVRSGNAGEWSPLLEARTDHAKYVSALRQGFNVVAAPQGVVMRRPGSALQCPVYDEGKNSSLIPFIFSNDQAVQVEVADFRMRFHFESGLLALPVTIITAATNAAGFCVFTSAGHGATVGKQVVLSGFAANVNLNGRIGTVTAVAGNDVTTNIPTPSLTGFGSVATARMAVVYSISSPYPHVDVSGIRYLADQDTVYLFHGSYPTKKLQRFGAYDWRITDVAFVDGPYATVNETTTRLTPNGSFPLGAVNPFMTSAVAPSGVASASTEVVGNEAWRAMDGARSTYWQSTTNQEAWLMYEFAAPTVVRGYVIEIPTTNTDAAHRAIDYAPVDWVFEGSFDGVVFTVLDAQRNYVVWDRGRSLYFPITNQTNYTRYRLNVFKLFANGALPVRVATLALTADSSQSVVFDASATVGINNGAGFSAADNGRLLSFLGSDGFWRQFKIQVVNSTTQFLAHCVADPLFDWVGTAEWQLGLFSSASGFATCGTFFEDRLVLGGVAQYPDYVAASVSGKYETFTSKYPNGQVTDELGFAVQLKARKLGRIAWLASDLKALLVGTGATEYAISSGDFNSALSARTIKARPATRRGSAAVEPVTIDSTVLFVQRANRTVRAMAFKQETESYQSPSMSTYASHIGTPRFQQMDYAAEPHSLVFFRRADGTLAVLAYNREEEIVGWQVWDVGGSIESISVIPSTDQSQDALWMVVKRNFIEGPQRRFIERITRFWDFDSTVLDVKMVDAHVVYEGAEATTIYGLYEFEGLEVCGNANGAPIAPQVVRNGSIVLPGPAVKVCVGPAPYDSIAETQRLEAGGTIGTAQGKDKTISDLKFRLWSSYGGFYAVRTSDGTVSEYVPIENLTPDTLLNGVPVLFSGDTPKLDVPQAFSTEGTVLYKQNGRLCPMPFNVVGVLPTVVTQDR